jgi:hypothetical protein
VGEESEGGDGKQKERNDAASGRHGDLGRVRRDAGARPPVWSFRK